MSIDFHRLMEPIDNNLLIFIDYIDYIDCFPMIDFHRLDPSGCISLLKHVCYAKDLRRGARPFTPTDF